MAVSRFGSLLKKASDIWSSLQDEDDEYENSNIQPRNKCTAAAVMGLHRQSSGLGTGMAVGGYLEEVVEAATGIVTDIIYTKNNVCVHIPQENDPTQVIHHHGYLTVKSVTGAVPYNNKGIGNSGTLILTWIPNSRIEKNSRAVKVHSSPSADTSPRPSSAPVSGTVSGEQPVFLLRGTTRRSPYHSRSPSPKPNTSVKSGCISPDRESQQSLELSHDIKRHRSGSKGGTSIVSHTDSGIVQDNDSVQSQPLTGTSTTAAAVSRKNLHLDLSAAQAHRDQQTDTADAGLLSVMATTPDIAVTPVSDGDDNDINVNAASSSTTTETTSNPDIDSDCYLDEHNQNLYLSGDADASLNGSIPQSSLLDVNPEFFALTHNLNFPDSLSPQQSASPSHSPRTQDSSTSATPTATGVGRCLAKREKKCGVFSVDLGQMKCISIFYNDDSCSSGQLVIASQESQYKILHFHHGGLDKLANDVFSSWHYLNEPRKGSNGGSDGESVAAAGQCKQFYICKRGQLSADQCHPEEGAYDNLTLDTWMSHMNDQGQIEDDLQLRKHIFFGGLSETLRSEAWPFLLHYYPFMSRFEEREQIRNDMYIKYQNIRKKREVMSGVDAEFFQKNIENIVDKDVIRTDRLNPYFSGDNNPNLDAMRNILLNYAVFNPQMGYTQGMSDLLAPLLAEIQQESDTFWCFVGLMQRTIFISTPKDHDMDHQLSYLRELIRLILPTFHCHLQRAKDAGELLFCHRWILLCFKREFRECEALKMWEACWSQYQTDYFHLFICLAIIAIYGNVVVRHQLPADEILLYFSNLSMHMNGYVVLRKARGLLHEFRAMSHIPCTLCGLCEMCGPGMWDSGHVPVIECVGHGESRTCPHNANSPERAPHGHTDLDQY